MACLSQGCCYSSAIFDGELSLATIKAACEAKKLRSLSVFKPEKFEINNIKEFVLYVVSNMTRLRSLNLYNKLGMENILVQLEKLKHLHVSSPRGGVNR